MKKLILLILGLSALGAFAQRRGNNAVADTFVKTHYIKHEYLIPMRDGIKLMTEVYVPKDQSKKYPFLMDRTPYSVAPYGDGMKPSIGPSMEYAKDGYIVVYQDVRGRFMSEGMFREMTPELEDHKTKKDVDEGTDTYDTIDWLLKNVPNNNGKVGVWGVSYPGFFTTASLLSRHPALAAASPQAPMSDLWRDDGWHNGAFFLVANFTFYPGFTNRQDDKPTQRRGGRGERITNGYDFYLKMGSVKNTNDKYYKDTIRLWSDMLNHPDFDEWWKSRNVLTHLHDIKTPTLVTGGWYDAEDLYGAINTYKTLAKENPKTPVYFVMGPWVHGGWANGPGDRLGDIYFGGPQGPHYRDDIEFKFFSHYLKDTPMDIEPINAFETGTNKWETYKTWPPKTAKEEQLYLLPGGKLSFTAPAAGKDSYDEYISDPANPVPFFADLNKTGDMERTYMDGDQRFAENRKDVLTYKTDVLDKDVTIAGNIWPKLNVSTTGTDADWIVKIIDVYPDTAANTIATGTGIKMAGYEQMVRSEPLRGKYRNDFSKPVPFVPGQVTPVSWELQDILHTFKKGHRIMIQIQSSMFPLIDRNPQTFVDIMKAKESDFKAATQRIYTSKDHPSFLKVRVMQ